MTPEILTYGVAGLAGLSVLLIFAALAGRSSVNDRLRRYASTDAKERRDQEEVKPNLGELISSSAALANINRAVENRDWGANMARELARADLALKPSEFLAVRVALVAGVPLSMIALSPVVPALNNPLLWVVGLVAGFLVPRIWVGRRQGRRLKAFNDGLADTITLLANSLRAGSSFLQAVEMVVRESRPPISTEFERIVREVNLGLTLEQALANMTRRVRSDDLELMATAISIHHQVGGNLAEILDSIAFTIRERIRIKGEIRVLTAQQRLSGYVVGLLPVGLFFVISTMAPDFTRPLFVAPPELLGLPLGIFILAGGAFMMLIGFVAIRRIVDIEV
jgi:tight adherence protein B